MHTPDCQPLSPQIQRFVPLSHSLPLSSILPGALIARVTLSGNKWDFQSIVRLVLCIPNWFDGFFYWFLISVSIAQMRRAYYVVSPFRSWNSNRKKERKNHSNYAFGIRNTAAHSFDLDSDSDREIRLDLTLKWNRNQTENKRELHEEETKRVGSV